MMKINTALNKMTFSLERKAGNFRKSLIRCQRRVKCCSSVKTTNGPHKRLHLFHYASSTEVTAAQEKNHPLSANGLEESITPALTSHTWSS